MDKTIQLTHFFRRASFGATWAELDRGNSPSVWLETWLADTNPPSKLPTLQPFERPDFKKDGDQAAKLKFLRQLKAQSGEFSKHLVEQMVTATNPLHERTVNFWRDHFVVAYKKVKVPQAIADYDQKLRTYAFGDFQDLLWHVTTSSAMMLYLDNNQNQVGQPNENYSRELLELFTVGRGNYTEKDIQEGARALTGWRMTPRSREAQFLPRRHDGAAKTYLGRQGNLKAEDVVQIVANHPATARTLARKLWTNFAYPNPEPAVVERIAQIYQTQGRNIGQVIRAIFTSPEFYSPKAYRSRLKSPLYFTVGTLRQLGIQADYAKVLASLRGMGQMPYNAPSVKGWPDDAGWLNAPSLLTRINLAQQFTQDYGDEGAFSYEPNHTAPELARLLLDSTDIQTSLKGLNIRETTALFLAAPLYQLA